MDVIIILITPTMWNLLVFNWPIFKDTEWLFFSVLLSSPLCCLQTRPLIQTIKMTGGTASRTSTSLWTKRLRGQFSHLINSSFFYWWSPSRNAWWFEGHVSPSDFILSVLRWLFVSFPIKSSLHRKRRLCRHSLYVPVFPTLSV